MAFDVKQHHLGRRDGSQGENLPSQNSDERAVCEGQ